MQESQGKVPKEFAFEQRRGMAVNYISICLCLTTPGPIPLWNMHLSSASFLFGFYPQHFAAEVEVKINTTGWIIKQAASGDFF